MGTTAQKIQYLDDTKQLLKENINNLGGNLTNEPFRQYASVLEGIYESLPKISGIGASLSLSPSLMGKIKLNEIQGDTYQKTNLYNNDIEQGAISEGVDISATNRIRTDGYIEVVPSTNIILNFTGCDDWYVSFYNNSKTFISAYGWQPKGNSVPIPANIYYIRVAFRKNDNSNITPSSISNVQIGNVPNPDYPQEIKSVTGLQNVTISNADNTQSNTYEVNLGNIELNKIGDYKDSIKKSTGKNLFDKDNANTLNSIINGNNGTLSAFDTCRTIYIPCKPNTTYAVSRISGTRFVVGTTTNQPTIGMVCNSFISNNTASSIRITTGANDNYLCVFYYNSGSDTLTEQAIRDTLMIQEGSIVSPYEPYGKVWYITENIGEVVLNGTESWETQWNGDNIHGWRTTIPNLKQTTGGSQSSYAISNNYETRTQDENFSTGSYGISNRANQSQIIIKNNDITSQNDFITWLSTHNTTVLYQLATPIYEVITNTELINQLESLYNAKSHEGTTNINVTSEDLSMILNVGVIKGDA